MEQRLSMISLGVADLTKAGVFYTQGLGWQPHPSSNDNITFIPLNSIVLALYSWQGLAEDAEVPAKGDGFRGIALAYNCREQDEVDDVLRQAVAAGGRLVKPAQNVFWGGYSGYFADLDGHLFEVAHNPFWDIAPDGTVLMTRE